MTRGAVWLLVPVLTCGACGSLERAESAPSSVEPRSGSSSEPGTLVAVKTFPRTFVWLEPMFENDFAPPEGKAYIGQQGQMFIPGEVLARAGQPIEFRSSEDVLHNVRVVRSDKTPIFNVATLPFGAYTHTFDEPGVYDVSCDIHTAMKATIFIASTPYIATSDETGRFSFPNVLRGTYKASGFDAGKRVEKIVEVSGSRVDVSLP
jgi:plastocyanin